MLRRSPIARKTPLRSTGSLLRRAVAKVRRPRDTGPDDHTKIRLTVRSGGICERCGIGDAIHRHHRRPRRMGGSRGGQVNALSNLTHLCLPCHEWTEREPNEAQRDGWLLHANDDPRVVPVKTRHGLVRLDEDGRWEAA